ncbi:hypothetical protein HK100_005107, partial [Physocladia obscura]
MTTDTDPRLSSRYGVSVCVHGLLRLPPELLQHVSLSYLDTRSLIALTSASRQLRLLLFAHQAAWFRPSKASLSTSASIARMPHTCIWDASDGIVSLGGTGFRFAYNGSALATARGWCIDDDTRDDSQGSNIGDDGAPISSVPESLLAVRVPPWAQPSHLEPKEQEQQQQPQEQQNFNNLIELQFRNFSPILDQSVRRKVSRSIFSRLPLPLATRSFSKDTPHLAYFEVTFKRRDDSSNCASPGNNGLEFEAMVGLVSIDAIDKPTHVPPNNRHSVCYESTYGMVSIGQRRGEGFQFAHSYSFGDTVGCGIVSLDNNDMNGDENMMINPNPEVLFQGKRPPSYLNRNGVIFFTLNGSWVGDVPWRISDDLIDYSKCIFPVVAFSVSVCPVEVLINLGQQPQPFLFDMTRWVTRGCNNMVTTLLSPTQPPEMGHEILPKYADATKRNLSQSIIDIPMRDRVTDYMESRYVRSQQRGGAPPLPTESIIKTHFDLRFLPAGIHDIDTIKNLGSCAFSLHSNHRLLRSGGAGSALPYIIENEDGTFKVSFRSMRYVDVTNVQSQYPLLPAPQSLAARSPFSSEGGLRRNGDGDKRDNYSGCSVHGDWRKSYFEVSIVSNSSVTPPPPQLPLATNNNEIPAIYHNINNNNINLPQQHHLLPHFFNPAIPAEILVNPDLVNNEDDDGDDDEWGIIQHPRETGFISIGLALRPYSPFYHVGWDFGSFGFHSDDGKLFDGAGQGGFMWAEPYSVGDVVGCGMTCSGDIYYTKNGRIIGPDRRRRWLQKRRIARNILSDPNHEQQHPKLGDNCAEVKQQSCNSQETLLVDNDFEEVEECCLKVGIIPASG